MYLITYEPKKLKVTGYFSEDEKINLLKDNTLFKTITNEIYEYLRKLEVEGDTYISKKSINNLILDKKIDFATKEIKNKITEQINIKDIENQNIELRNEIKEIKQEVLLLKDEIKKLKGGKKYGR